jgi:hypothetical protein
MPAGFELGELRIGGFDLALTETSTECDHGRRFGRRADLADRQVIDFAVYQIAGVLPPMMTMPEQIVMRAIAELIPYARNARTRSAEQIAQIAASMRRVRLHQSGADRRRERHHRRPRQGPRSAPHL